MDKVVYRWHITAQYRFDKDCVLNFCVNASTEEEACSIAQSKIDSAVYIRDFAECHFGIGATVLGRVEI